jgi:hypothetical protein
MSEFDKDKVGNGLTELSRRDFLKLAAAAGCVGTAIIVVGCSSGGSGGGIDGGSGSGGGGGTSRSATAVLDVTITDAVKEMVTHEPNNPAAGAADCYFWVYRVKDVTDPANVVEFPPDCPGPQIYALVGDVITVNVTNALDGPHSFAIPGLAVDSGPIAPGETKSVTVVAGVAGAFLYQDNHNSPVGRVMGLHGAIVVVPAAPQSGPKLTPYQNPSASVQQLFDDFGSQPWWPGLAWGVGDTANNTPAGRQHVWLAHQASPVLFDEVGRFAMENPGADYPAADFIEAFCNDPFINTSNDDRTVTSAEHPVKFNETVTLPDGVTTMVRGVFNRKPHFFTINGQSGFFAHHNPAITPMYRVGEPCVVRVLNAGLWSHCFHQHSNHFYVAAIDNVPQENPIWVDVFNIMPLRGVDYVIPFMRPPDVPNARGIGRADAPRATLAGGTTWPPVEEMARHMPEQGAVLVTNFAGTATADMAMRQSPLCFPMHDHSEPSQTAQGGNYNCGMIAGVYYFGDRNTPGALNFTLEADFQMMIGTGRHSGETGPPVGGWPPEDENP